MTATGSVRVKAHTTDAATSSGSKTPNPVSLRVPLQRLLIGARIQEAGRDVAWLDGRDLDAHASRLQSQSLR